MHQSRDFSRQVYPCLFTNTQTFCIFVDPLFSEPHTDHNRANIGRLLYNLLKGQYSVFVDIVNCFPSYLDRSPAVEGSIMRADTAAALHCTIALSISLSTIPCSPSSIVSTMLLPLASLSTPAESVFPLASLSRNTFPPLVFRYLSNWSST